MPEFIVEVTDTNDVTYYNNGQIPVVEILLGVPGPPGADGSFIADADSIDDGAAKVLMTIAERAKLAAIQALATANQADSVLLNRTYQTGFQSADTVVNGTANKVYTAAEKIKLGGLAPGATVNSADTVLLNRFYHYGTQSYTTISDLITWLGINLIAGPGITIQPDINGKLVVSMTDITPAPGTSSYPGTNKFPSTSSFPGTF